MKKKSAKLISIVILLIFLLWLVPFPKRINTTLHGIQYDRINSGYSVASSLSLDGWYFMYLFKPSIYKGSLIVSTESNDDLLSCYGLRLTFAKNSGCEGSIASLLYYNGKTNEMTVGGILSELGGFDKIVLDQGETVISAPASNRDEARSVTEEVYFW